MRILIIESSTTLSKLIHQQLEDEYFVVDTARNGKRGLRLACNTEYDVIILTCTLPDKSGAAVCKEIRNYGRSTPIMVLSGKDDIGHKVNFFNLGADDYIVKPFSMAELIARVRALLRRPHAITPDVLQLEDLLVDIRSHQAVRADQELTLTRREMELLVYLLRNKGEVLSRGQIMEHVWDHHADIFSNTIETHILNLRKKIDRNNQRKLIHTVPGRGYKVA